MRTLLLSLAVVLFPSSLKGEDWPCFRGPQHNGISTEKGWQTRWPAKGPTIVWKANVGTGFSSLAVAAGKVYTLGNDDSEDTVYCFDATTGKKLWHHSYEAALGDLYFDGGPGATPTVKGTSVYTLSRWGDLFCLDANTGKVRWKKNVARELDLPQPTWGFTGSPLVHDNSLVLIMGEAGVALNKKTGKVIWKSAAREAGYSTPVPFKARGKTCVALGTSNAFVAVDLATGKVLWEHRWITRYGVNAADPIITPTHVFLSSGYGKGATLLKRTDGKPTTVWRHRKMRNQFHSSILLDGFVYGIDGDTTERADLVCLEWKTGKERWRYRAVGSGALMAAAGQLIVLDAKGQLMIGPASSTGFTPTSRARVLKGKCWTVPVLANGRIYCRNAIGDIVCVDVRK